MSLSDILIVIVGLSFFEIISSIDNAVVNADVLTTLSPRWRSWFLSYGILFAVFVVRGLVPLLIVYAATPGISLWGAFTAGMSGDPLVRDAIERHAPDLLAGGGIFLVLLFLQWLFLEHKNYAFFFETHIHKKYGVWFYALVSLVLLGFAWISGNDFPRIFGGLVGSSGFFIVSGFRHYAEEKEKELTRGGSMSAISKIMYLELIDATFSLDGVLGAFAFTLSIPLILIGNGIGALIVRYGTVRGIDFVHRYAYLKNGAMYSIGFLGLIMLGESLGQHVASWMPPAITVAVVGLFFYLSVRELKKEHAL